MHKMCNTDFLSVQSSFVHGTLELYYFKQGTLETFIIQIALTISK